MDNYEFLYRLYNDNTKKLGGVWFKGTSKDIWAEDHSHIYFSDEEVDNIATLPESEREVFALNLAQSKLPPPQNVSASTTSTTSTENISVVNSN